MRSEIDGYILTGGNSSRMGGQSKAAILLNGRTFAQRVAEAMSPNVRRAFTVGRPVLYPSIENVDDDFFGTRSSIAGLCTALRHSSAEWIIVSACDMPFVTEQLFGVLASEISAANGSVVPVSVDGVLQPTCALYNVSACYETCKAAIDNGELSLIRLLSHLNAKYLPHDIFQGLAGSEHFFSNVNTPEDLASAYALIESGQAF